MRPNPLTVRLSGDVLAWLTSYAERSGRSRNSVVAEAVAAYRRLAEPTRLDELRALRARAADKEIRR